MPNVTSIADTEMSTEVGEDQQALNVDQSYDEPHDDIEEESDDEDTTTD